MKLTDWWPVGSDWWAVAFFACCLGAIFALDHQWLPSDLFGHENARENDPTFMSAKGWACKRYFTDSEWSRLTSALSDEHIKNATCREMTAMLPDNNVESAAGDCFSQMNSLENDVWSTLSWHSTTRLDRLPCDSERRVLDTLANVSHEYRDEQVDRLFDRALGH